MMRSGLLKRMENISAMFYIFLNWDQNNLQPPQKITLRLELANKFPASAAYRYELLTDSKASKRQFLQLNLKSNLLVADSFKMDVDNPMIYAPNDKVTQRIRLPTTSASASSASEVVHAGMPVRDIMRLFLDGVEGNIIGKYKRGQKLGEGTYGVVYKATDENNNTFALKKIRLDHDEQQGVPATTIREVVALQELTHPNIVKLLATHLQAGSLWLVFEYLNYDLRRYMEQEFTNRQREMPDQLIQRFFYQILLGMDFMHKRRYLHRDLKPQNILVKDDGTVKLADFGLARLVGCPVRILTHEIVTLYYRSPEVLLGNHDSAYGPGVDIWSLGCILGEMYKLEPLFEGDSEIDQLYQIFRVLSTPTEEAWPGITCYPCYQQIFPRWTGVKLKDALPKRVSPEVCDLLRQMLVYYPGNRIQCSEALNHPFFADVENMPESLSATKAGMQQNAVEVKSSFFGKQAQKQLDGNACSVAVA